MAERSHKASRERIVTTICNNASNSNPEEPPQQHPIVKKQNTPPTPNLNKYGRDLSDLARNGKIDLVIGRNNEIERVVQILLRRTKNNPVLVGEPGVGKTAIVEGLAHYFASNDAPPELREKRLITLNLSSIVAGTKYRGEFEERIKAIIKEAKSDPNIILFIDELHTLIGAGSPGGSAMDASNILKPELSSRSLQIIGATTLNEYKKYIEKDAALERRFQRVKVEPPTATETIAILRGLRSSFELHHNVTYSDEAIEAAVQLSDRYFPDRFQPDKAIDLIDEAGARVNLGYDNYDPRYRETTLQLFAKLKELRIAVRREDLPSKDALDAEIRILKQQVFELKTTHDLKRQSDPAIVTEEVIFDLVSASTGIPVGSLTNDLKTKLLSIDEEIGKNVIGQDEAVSAVCRCFRRARTQLKDPKRPIGSFLFLGPTGVGKTLLAKNIAKILFQDENALVRIDMSEYMEKFSMSRLIGAPPGHVGYNEGGQLTEQVRRRPYSVVLLDEVEKAHPDIMNLFLQILEDGHCTDSTGRVVNFKDTVIIMTSNLGAKPLKDDRVGFHLHINDSIDYESHKKSALAAVKGFLRPEMINRFDELIVFNHLELPQMNLVIETELAQLYERMNSIHRDLILSEEAKKLLIEKGFDPEYGARPLRRAISNLLIDRLSEEILTGNIPENSTVIVDRDGDLCTFQILAGRMQEEEDALLLV